MTAETLLGRLRGVQYCCDRPYAASVAREAADRIERLEKSLETARDDALEEADDPWAYSLTENATAHQLCEGISVGIRALKDKEVEG